MPNKNLSIALITTFLSFCTLYVPQPILPQLAAEFNVSAADSGLLITLTLLPLALAPIVYGYFLQAIPARTMVRAAVLLLIVNQFAFYWASAFWHLLALRFLQGLLMPAILTALTTYCATMASPDKIGRTMGWYVGATIAGGCTSRALGGVLTEYLGWPLMFVAVGAMMLPAWWLLHRLDADAEINFQRLSAAAIKRVLALALYRNSYILLSLTFFGFAGVLNLLSFRLVEIDPSGSAARASLLYLGYLAGIPAAVWSEQIVARLGGFARALWLGLGCYALGLSAYFIASPAVMFATMFAFAGGMFFIHATLCAMTNARATEHKGVVNGLYVSVYYSSAALGSWLLGFWYAHFGWHQLLWLVASMALVAALLAGRINPPMK